MARYVFKNDGWVDLKTGEPMKTQEGIFAPMLCRDIAPYVSPVTHKVVDGRAARRDDLARTGSRPVDPSEFKVTYNNKKYAEAEKAEWEPRKAVDLGQGYRRGPS